ncbi:MerR family DNA-binding transcriptional regulator [Actinomadura sp. NPDC047616]|uniref:MerR family DNA-binding transcriptional regulator n=1 Tax=Actinomadura sp. NPDC047616 TaxID=3155914 RepID=UPI0033FF53B2
MDDLIPIRDVADRFALPISTLHYWERRGLLAPRRRAGRRRPGSTGRRLGAAHDRRLAEHRARDLH